MKNALKTVFLFPVVAAVMCGIVFLVWINEKERRA
jgi:hypothetical protein